MFPYALIILTGQIGRKSLLLYILILIIYFIKFYLMLIITGVKYKYWTFELTSKFYLFYSATTIFQILIRFFQRIFSSLFNKFWLFYSNYPLIYIGIIYFLSAIFIYLLFLFYTSIDILIIFIFTFFLSGSLLPFFKERQERDGWQ